MKIAAVLATLVLLLVGCGGEDDSRPGFSSEENEFLDGLVSQGVEIEHTEQQLVDLGHSVCDVMRATQDDPVGREQVLFGLNVNDDAPQAVVYGNAKVFLCPEYK